MVWFSWTASGLLHDRRAKHAARAGSGGCRTALGETGGVNRVVLVRRGEGLVEARECRDDGTAPTVTVLPADELAAFVAEREHGAVRWVWDDTTRWYPALLDAGVRVERCTDLRLCHAVLRRSPFVDQALLAGDETAGWDALQPVTAADPALFPLEDPADRLDPAAEHDRQRRGAGRVGRARAARACCSPPSPPARWSPPR